MYLNILSVDINPYLKRYKYNDSIKWAVNLNFKKLLIIIYELIIIQ